jgi:diguanylate cyclase (GGDEF)-like protein
MGQLSACSRGWPDGPLGGAVTETLCLRVCAHFRRDVEAALSHLGAKDVRVQVYPSVCTLNPGRCDPVETPAAPLQEGCDGVLVFFGCGPDIRETPTDPRVQIVRLEHCTQLLAGRDTLAREIQSGSYLVTAGWLKHWREHLRAMGFDRETASRFFQECSRELLLLDTGTDPDAFSELEAMGRYLSLPYRSRFVGLDYLGLLLDDAIHRWRHTAAAAGTREVLARANQKVADYAMAFDLMVRLSHLTDETTTINAVREMFAMLFGCTNLVYAQVKDGRVEQIFAADEQADDRISLQQALDALHEGYLIMPSGNGFFLRIDYRNTMLGLILVREIPFPAYRDQYLNLGLAISNLCGLAISNSRTFATLKETERNLLEERDKNARLSEQLRVLANTDPLTGLYNRRHFLQLAETEFAAAKRYRAPASLIMLDIDHFKQLNETFGRAAGDQVLAKVAGRLGALRVSDIAARYGGEKLVALCPGTGKQAAVKLAERLCRGFREPPIETSAGPVSMTVSIGIATIDSSVRDLDELIDRAGHALDAAKSAGRDRVSVFTRLEPDPEPG